MFFQAGLTIASAGGHPDATGGGIVRDCLFVGWSDNKGQAEDGQPGINTFKGSRFFAPSLPCRCLTLIALQARPLLAARACLCAATSSTTARRRYLLPLISLFVDFMLDSAPFRSSTATPSCATSLTPRRRTRRLACSTRTCGRWPVSPSAACRCLWWCVLTLLVLPATNEVKASTFDAESKRYWVNIGAKGNQALRLDGDTNSVIADRQVRTWTLPVPLCSDL